MRGVARCRAAHRSPQGHPPAGRLPAQYFLRSYGRRGKVEWGVARDVEIGGNRATAFAVYHPAYRRRNPGLGDRLYGRVAERVRRLLPISRRSSGTTEVSPQSRSRCGPTNSASPRADPRRLSVSTDDGRSLVGRDQDHSHTMPTGSCRLVTTLQASTRPLIRDEGSRPSSSRRSER